jgi:hypothetical protein
MSGPEAIRSPGSQLGPALLGIVPVKIIGQAKHAAGWRQLRRKQRGGEKIIGWNGVGLLLRGHERFINRQGPGKVKLIRRSAPENQQA